MPGPLITLIPPSTATTSSLSTCRAQRWELSGDKDTEHANSSIGCPSTPPSSVLMNSTAVSVASSSSGSAAIGPSLMPMKPTFTGAASGSARSAVAGRSPSNHVASGKRSITGPSSLIGS